MATPSSHPVSRCRKITHRRIGCIQYLVTNTPEYCGKILVHEKNTTTPAHAHHDKHETFLVFSGRLRMVVDGEPVVLHPGDVLPIERNVSHEFTALEDNTVIIEFSTPSSRHDSFFAQDGMWEEVNDRTDEEATEWPFDLRVDVENADGSEASDG